MSPTLEQFRAMSPEEQRATVANMNRQWEAKVRSTLDEVFDRHGLEQQLVPKITFRPPAPPTPIAPPLPPAEDQDSAARAFFRRFPETRQIQIGSTLYQR